MGGYLANGSAPQTRVAFTPITSLFLLENIHCGCHWNRLAETIPMSTHYVCFCAEIRKLEMFLSGK